MRIQSSTSQEGSKPEWNQGYYLLAFKRPTQLKSFLSPSSLETFQLTCLTYKTLTKLLYCFRPQDLRTLNLADNSLEDLAPKIFQMLTKLKSLDLSRNPLEDLHPDVFKDIIVGFHSSLPPLLNWLNNLSLFCRTIKDLKVLKCRGCRLQNINPQLYNLLNQLTELDLGNNQVIWCDDIYDPLHLARAVKNWSKNWVGTEDEWKVLFGLLKASQRQSSKPLTEFIYPKAPTTPLHSSKLQPHFMDVNKSFVPRDEILSLGYYHHFFTSYLFSFNTLGLSLSHSTEIFIIPFFPHKRTSSLDQWAEKKTHTQLTWSFYQSVKRCLCFLSTADGFSRIILFVCLLGLKIIYTKP